MSAPAGAPRLRILYTGAFRFPEGDAAAFRVQAVARLFSEAGHEVAFAGWEDGAAPYTYAGSDCFPQSEFRSERVPALTRLAGFLLRGRRTLAWLKTVPAYDVVIAYNPPAIFAILLKSYGRAHGIKVVIDSTEWYQASHLPGGAWGPAAAENWLRMHLAYRLYPNLIVISRLLERHFSGRNLVRIPPLLPVPLAPVARAIPGPALRILYAGEAGRKDRLAQLVTALPALAAQLALPLELHIAGMDQAQLRALPGMPAWGPGLAAQVQCHGRVAREQVLALYRHCHFSVLFREDARYAHAGFPTKAMESWSQGCPLITNAVGDLRALAVHMGNAIVLEEDQLVTGLGPLLGALLTPGRYDAMVRQCLATAEAQFAPERYAGPVADFVRQLKN